MPGAVHPKVKLLIDSDGGVDDVLAIAWQHNGWNRAISYSPAFRERSYCQATHNLSLIPRRALRHHTLPHMLTNPVYAGAYAFGRRTKQTTITNGRKRVVRSCAASKRLERFAQGAPCGLYQLGRIREESATDADNANGKSYMRRGSIRSAGGAVQMRTLRTQAPHNLQRNGRSDATLCLRGAFGEPRWAVHRFGGMRVDRAVAKEVIERLQPLSVEAALAAMELNGQEQSEKRRQRDNATTPCRRAMIRMGAPAI